MIYQNKVKNILYNKNKLNLAIFQINKKNITIKIV